MCIPALNIWICVRKWEYLSWTLVSTIPIKENCFFEVRKIIRKFKGQKKFKELCSKYGFLHTNDKKECVLTLKNKGMEELINRLTIQNWSYAEAFALLQGANAWKKWFKLVYKEEGRNLDDKELENLDTYTTNLFQDFTGDDSCPSLEVGSYLQELERKLSTESFKELKSIFPKIHDNKLNFAENLIIQYALPHHHTCCFVYMTL